MKLTLTSHIANEYHVDVIGEVSHKSHDFDEPLRQVVGSFASRRVLLNLESATRIDSSGIRWLLVCQRAICQAQGELVLHSVPPSIVTPLGLLNLLARFATAENAKAARHILQTEVA